MSSPLYRGVLVTVRVAPLFYWQSFIIAPCTRTVAAVIVFVVTFQTMNRYTVLFTCQRGRAGNFRSVLAESPLAAQKLVEETTPTLGAVYEVRDYIGPAGN